MSEGSKSEPVRFGPPAKVWVGLGILIVVTLVGWRLQRRYLPTCGQVADHAIDVIREINFDTQDSEGQIRQECVDQEWSMADRRALMTADTLGQLLAARPRVYR